MKLALSIFWRGLAAMVTFKTVNCMNTNLAVRINFDSSFL